MVWVCKITPWFWDIHQKGSRQVKVHIIVLKMALKVLVSLLIMLPLLICPVGGAELSHLDVFLSDFASHHQLSHISILMNKNWTARDRRVADFKKHFKTGTGRTFMAITEFNKAWRRNRWVVEILLLPTVGTMCCYLFKAGFCFILLTHKETNRDDYLDLQPSSASSAGGDAKGCLDH